MADDEVGLPLRERTALVRCRCVILVYGKVPNRCPAPIADPDSPLCDRCYNMHQSGTDLDPGDVFEMAPL